MTPYENNVTNRVLHVLQVAVNAQSSLLHSRLTLDAISQEKLAEYLVSLKELPEDSEEIQVELKRQIAEAFYAGDFPKAAILLAVAMTAGKHFTYYSVD